MSRITNTERARIFGPRCTPANFVTLHTPWGIHVTVHHLVADIFGDACDHARRTSAWTPARIDGYACRAIRGSQAPSLHSWALAWDFFDTPMPASIWGPDNAPDAPFRQAFKDFGFYAGAEFSSRADYPHLEWAAGTPPVHSSTPTTSPAETVYPTTRHSMEGIAVARRIISVPTDGAGRGHAATDIPYDKLLSLTPWAAWIPEDHKGVYLPVGSAGHHDRDGKVEIFVEGTIHDGTTLVLAVWGD
jgi:hypothetical protein